MDNTTELLCRICNEKLIRNLLLKEMQLGLREEFSYTTCSKCGAIQIVDVPDNMDKYYPPYYPPFHSKVPKLRQLPLLKQLFKNFRLKRKYRLSNNYALNILKPIKPAFNDLILDIGCGNGALICNLYNQGFKNVSGIDRFIPNEIDYGHQVKVIKKDISELQNESYDILMLNHVLEHIDDQFTILNECRRILKKTGTVIIAIPIVGSAYEIYKENWVQLDAPRHFVIHTLQSLSLLAKQTGFSVNRVIHNSTSFQFLGSELYVRDIPLTISGTEKLFPVNQIFSKEEIEKFEKQALELNRLKKGDQALFYLTKN